MKVLLLNENKRRILIDALDAYLANLIDDFSEGGGFYSDFTYGEEIYKTLSGKKWGQPL